MEPIHYFSPRLENSNNVYQIYQQKPFTIYVRDAFGPQNLNLTYHLSKGAPKWLKLDIVNGILYGTAPHVHYHKLFKVAIVATNDMGAVTKSFFIKVICTDLVDTMAGTLAAALSLDKSTYPVSRLNPRPSLLTYIYAFYNQHRFRKWFYKSLQQAANQFGKKIFDPAKPEHFEKFIKELAPNIEHELAQHLHSHVFQEVHFSYPQLEHFIEHQHYSVELGLPHWENLYRMNLDEQNMDWQMLVDVLQLTEQWLLEFQLQHTHDHNTWLALESPKLLPHSGQYESEQSD